MNAKKYLISMTGTIARKQFQDANNLIDGYNRIRTELIRASREAAGSSLLAGFTSILTQYPEIARATPDELKGQLDSGPAARKFVVWVFKWEGGEWIKQVERALNTDNEDQARKYVADVNAVSRMDRHIEFGRQEEGAQPGRKPGRHNLVEAGWLGIQI